MAYGIWRTKSSAFCYWRFSGEKNRMAFTKEQEGKTMEEIVKKIREKLAENMKLTELLTGLLRDCPEGHLRLTTTDGYPRYYQISGSRKKYLGKKELDLRKGLAGKDYYRKLLRETEEETKAIQQFLKRTDPKAKIKAYEEMHDKRKQYIDPLVLPDDLYARKWLEESKRNAALRRNSYEKPEGLLTQNGEYVRSKSEKILADTYWYNGILYVYEYPLMLEDGWVFSDFKLLNLRLRKTVYQEHFGRMDDPDYAEAAVQKIQRYERSGYHMGDQIIYTMETSGNPLNMKDVERMIRQYLL